MCLCVCSVIQDEVDLKSEGISPVLNPGHFDFEVSECFLLGSPLGLVLAMRHTVLPSVQSEWNVWLHHISFIWKCSSIFCHIVFHCLLLLGRQFALDISIRVNCSSHMNLQGEIQLLTYSITILSAAVLSVSQLRPACSQIFNLFYSSDPSASRLEPLLNSYFHRLPPFPVPRYQRYPLGDGRSTLVGKDKTIILFIKLLYNKSASMHAYFRH